MIKKKKENTFENTQTVSFCLNPKLLLCLLLVLLLLLFFVPKSLEMRACHATHWLFLS